MELAAADVAGPPTSAPTFSPAYDGAPALLPRRPAWRGRVGSVLPVGSVCAHHEYPVVPEGEPRRLPPTPVLSSTVVPPATLATLYKPYLRHRAPGRCAMPDAAIRCHCECHVHRRGSGGAGAVSEPSGAQPALARGAREPASGHRVAREWGPQHLVRAEHYAPRTRPGRSGQHHAELARAEPRPRRYARQHWADGV